MRRHIRLITTIIAVALISSLAQSAPATSSADGIALFSASVGNIVLPPPGETTDTGNTNFVLELQQDSDAATIEQEVRQLGAIPLYHTNFAYSGIAVNAPAALAERLDHIRGVKAMHILPPKQRLRTRITSTKIHRDEKHPAGLGSGEGIRIGVIDSGIDYTHATFGGAGTVTAYDANNPAIVEPGSFPTEKVAGGFDFVGDSYDADGALGSPVPTPDEDPLDCRIPDTASTLNRGGHGTHIAATIAGSGVISQTDDMSMSSKGSDDTPTYALAPGIAPKATLYAYKVFGCRGSTAFIAKAIEHAVDPNGDGDYSDRQVDVLTIATGSPFGGDDDPDSQAVNKAVAAGVTVVIAVGDNGNTFFTASAPGSATSAITVGALDTVPDLASFSSRGPQRGTRSIKPDLVAAGTGIMSAAAGTGQGTIALDGTSSAAAQVAGAAALILEQHRYWSPTQIKAALINTAIPLKNSTGLDYPASLAGAGKLNLAGLQDLHVLAYVDGDPAAGSISFGAPWLLKPWSDTRTLSLYNNDSFARVVQLSSTTTVSETGVVISVPSELIKLPPHAATNIDVQVMVDPSKISETPDALTPAVQGILDRYSLSEHSGYINITDAAYAHVRWAQISDTKLAFYLDGQRIEKDLIQDPEKSVLSVVPGQHVVTILPEDAEYGVATPILQQNVELKPLADYIFGVIANGTAAFLAPVEIQHKTSTESLVRIVNTATVPVDAYIDGTLVASKLGFLGSTGLLNISTGKHLIEFFQVGDTSGSGRLEHTQIEAVPGSTFLVGLGQSNHSCYSGSCSPNLFDFTVTLSNGCITPISMNVPFQIFPKSAAAARASTNEIAVAPSQRSVNIAIQNDGARNVENSARGAQTPLVAAFELGASSPQNSGITGALSAADIHYVGVTSNYSNTQSVDTSILYFATASYGPWSTPNEVQHRIYLDVTGPSGVPDGIDDHVLVNTSFGVITNGQQTDTFVSLLYDIKSDGGLIWSGFFARHNALPSPNNSPFLDVAPYNSTVMFQQVRTSFLIGLTDKQPKLRYHIETRARDASGFTEVVDRVPATGSIEYDLTKTAVLPINAGRGTPNLFTRPLFLDTTGSIIQTQVNPAILASRGKQDILLLHLHNLPEDQAELVTLYPTH